MSASAQTATRLFAPWELQIDSWAALQESVTALTERYGHIDLTWRGSRNAEWGGVMSSLYRALSSRLGRPPSENEMNTAEKRTLLLAREEW